MQRSVRLRSPFLDDAESMEAHKDLGRSFGDLEKLASVLRLSLDFTPHQSSFLTKKSSEQAIVARHDAS